MRRRTCIRKSQKRCGDARRKSRKKSALPQLLPSAPFSSCVAATSYITLFRTAYLFCAFFVLRCRISAPFSFCVAAFLPLSRFALPQLLVTLFRTALPHLSATSYITFLFCVAACLASPQFLLFCFSRFALLQLFLRLSRFASPQVLNYITLFQTTSPQVLYYVVSNCVAASCTFIALFVVLRRRIFGPLLFLYYNAPFEPLRFLRRRTPGLFYILRLTSILN